jgi:geranylgeranyl diphosphate synthase type I
MENLAELRQKVEDELRSEVPGGSTPLFGLNLMNAYHLGFSDQKGHSVKGSKGKYLRPVFCLAICGGLGGDIDKALPAAACLELTHRTTLIFDDIQDVGKERNGQPTMWTVWGENQAINAGLALSCYARMAAHRCYQRGLSPETVLGILSVLENAVLNLCWGQYYDLSFMETLNVTEQEYLGMVQGKTAALFGVACEVGALAAGVDDYKRLHSRELGINLGIAFQIHDDYLGIWGDEKEVGKTANDLIEKKRTLPIVLSLTRRQGQMKKWLQLPEIDPAMAANIKVWMEREGIDEEIKNKESHYLREARTDLAALSLKQEAAEHFEGLISFLGERKL